MSLSDWLNDPTPLEIAPEAPPSPVPSVPFSSLPPIVCTLVVGSRAYHRASLYRKFQAATTWTIPEILGVQRELQTAFRQPHPDVRACADLLTRIEAFVATQEKR